MGNEQPSCTVWFSALLWSRSKRRGGGTRGKKNKKKDEALLIHLVLLRTHWMSRRRPLLQGRRSGADLNWTDGQNKCVGSRGGLAGLTHGGAAAL